MKKQVLTVICLLTGCVTPSVSDVSGSEVQNAYADHDRQPPVIQLLAEEITLKKGEVPNPKSYVLWVFDPGNGLLPYAEKESGVSEKGSWTAVIPSDYEGKETFVIVFTAVDSCGNRTEKELNVKTETEQTKTDPSEPSEQEKEEKTQSDGIPSSYTVSSQTPAVIIPKDSQSAVESEKEDSEQPVHVHDWKPVYRTVIHDEVFHYEYEEIQVKDSDAWEEPVYEYYAVTVCRRCGHEEYGEDQITAMGTHIGTEHDYAASYRTDTRKRQTGTILHDAVFHTEIIEHKVVDCESYGEEVIDRYICQCGAEQ